MNTEKEIEKISTILGNGTFEYRGTTYTLDKEATSNNWHNQHLEGKPIKKLVGYDSQGNTVIVWSHDCESVTLPIPEFDEGTTTEEPEPKPDPVPVVKKKSPRKKKKK